MTKIQHSFYVYWDEQGNEHNETPISKPAPEGWYNYTYAKWANIVTRNNGVETYFVGIPRYEYKLNSTSQRSSIKFILGTGTDTTEGYQIPEAFTFGGQELTGYWISKYELTQEESEERIKAELSAGDTYINVRDIQGTLIDAIEEGTELEIEYYLDGEKQKTGNNLKEHYKYEKLTLDTEYTINIIVREKESGKYIGAVTKKVKTKKVNEPDVSKFDSSNTYYVIYKEDGQKEEKSITEDPPEDWYDYSNQRWANIVTKANETETYFVWIPRYEYRILTDRANLSLNSRRTEVNFISGTDTNTTEEYQIPEAFTFGDQELKGYWITKYELNEKN